MRFEIMERMDAQGTVLIKLDEEQVRAVAKQAVAQGAEAIAILFLHSYRNPAHEQRAKEMIEREFPRSVRHGLARAVSQEYREYERTSTAAANAYVGPRVRTYLTEMETHLGERGLRRQFPDRAVDRRPVRRRRRAARPASACWSPVRPPA